MGFFCTVKYHSKGGKFFVRCCNVGGNWHLCRKHNGETFRNFVTCKNETLLYVTLNLPIHLKEICNFGGRWIQLVQDRVKWEALVQIAQNFIITYFLKILLNYEG